MAGFAGLDASRRYRVASDGKTLLYLRGDGKWVPTTLERERARTGTVAPGSAAPAAPGGQVPLPPDPTYEATRLGLGTARDITTAGLTKSRTDTLSDYGFKETGFDPTKYDPLHPDANLQGTLTVDPSNPFSKASLLKSTYDTSRRGRGQQMGAAGQLYAGAYQQTQDFTNRQQLQGEDALTKSLIRFLGENTQGYGKAGTDYTTGVSTAAGESAARATASPLYEPTPPPAAAPAPAVRGAGLPQKTVHGQRFYQRASDKKWIPF